MKKNRITYGLLGFGFITLICNPFFGKATIKHSNTAIKKEIRIEKSGIKSKTDSNFLFMKNLEIYSNILKNVYLNYVDTVNVNKIVHLSIDQLLGYLDPYTEYYDSNEVKELELMTTGEYGGIGSIIMPREDSSVMIAAPMKGMPAERAGLKPGDIILKIDGKDFTKSTTPLVSKALKGEPGSIITLLVKRPGVDNPIQFKFKRKTIVMNQVPYYGVLDNNIGYINLTGFTDKAYDEFYNAFKALKTKNIKGLIIDLRNNPGGLVSQGVKIVNLFVEKGSTIVSLRGRNQKTSVVKATNHPIDKKIPIVVLVNGNSASCSEIVSGALQDMDRAVIMGTKSFGKGLVQGTMAVPFDGMMKMTTAKYYTPSGRCIQKINYNAARSGKGEIELKESETKVFKTRNGRLVRDAGGILPDIVIPQDSLSTFMLYIGTKQSVFDWITKYTLKHKMIAPAGEFSITEKDFDDFSQYLLKHHFEYKYSFTPYMKRMEALIKKEGLMSETQKLLDNLNKALAPNLERDLKCNREKIIEYLNIEICRRYYNMEGSIRESTNYDKTIKEAIQLLNDPQKIESILSPSKNKK